MESLNSSKSVNRLGRGLDVLLGPENSKDQILLLDIEKIVPNKAQPRKDFDSSLLKELAQSIKENGVLQAILVEKRGETYQIIAGERRWRASCMAGLKKIPAVLKKVENEKDLAFWALAENLQREDLNPIEQALAFKKIMEKTNLNQELLARKLGISRPSLANSLRLLNLEPEVRELVKQKKLSFSQARELLRIKEPLKQKEMALACLKKSLSVRKIKQKKGEKAPPFWLGQSLAQIERKIDLALKLHYSKGKGFVGFSFKNDEELKKILHKLS